MRILGISTAHDSSVAIINDGVVEYFSKEERLTRIKRDRQPFKALQCAVQNSKGKINFVVICSPTPKDNFNDLLENYIKKILNVKVIRFCSYHHLAHASLSFYNSGFDKALCFVIDRNGAELEEKMRESESVFVADYPNNFKPIYKNFFLKNIGENYDVDNYKIVKSILKEYSDCEIKADSTLNITKVYETATTLIGQNPLENGKTMGLSAYGKDKDFEQLFLNGLPNTNIFLHKNGDDKQPILKKYLYNQTDTVPKENYELYADYAYQVQKQTQNVVLELVKKFVKKTGIHNVCFSGGYALNVVTNGFLIKNLPNVNFYFEPLSDDSGNSIGSAMFVYRNETKDTNIHKLKHTFFNNIKHNIYVKGESVDEKQISVFLNQGKSVAVFNEQAEAGPRSLGNRSILFSAENKLAKQIINKIKNREWYRPFACSILKEYSKEYFEMFDLEESPFMTISFQSKTNKIPGVVHIDNSCRIQTVDNQIPHLYNLLQHFYNISKVPVLLNTSFNLSGEPLVETPEEAIDVFNRSKIDILWFPEKNIMLTK